MYLILSSQSIITGAFIPLTMEGRIVVDGVLASCYPFGNHDLAHISMMPIRWFPKVMEWFFVMEDGLTSFAKVAEKLGNYVLPYHLLY